MVLEDELEGRGEGAADGLGDVGDGDAALDLPHEPGAEAARAVDDLLDGAARAVLEGCKQDSGGGLAWPGEAGGHDGGVGDDLGNLRDEGLQLAKLPVRELGGGAIRGHHEGKDAALVLVRQEILVERVEEGEHGAAGEEGDEGDEKDAGDAAKGERQASKGP